MNKCQMFLFRRKYTKTNVEIEVYRKYLFTLEGNPILFVN